MKIMLVLILIFLEDSFGEVKKVAIGEAKDLVLILIFLEDSFGVIVEETLELPGQSLNPYFFGG